MRDDNCLMMIFLNVFEMFVVDRAPMDLQEAFSGEYQQQMNGADLLLLV